MPRFCAGAGADALARILRCPVVVMVVVVVVEVKKDGGYEFDL